jgi:antitoxin ParD1/3/4
MNRQKILLEQSNNNWIHAKLEKAEKSGFTTDSKYEILKQSKALLKL